MDIAGKFLSILINICQQCPVSALKQMTGSFSFQIKINRISAIDVMHDLRQVSGGCLKQNMIMVIHKAVTMNDRFITLAG